MSLRITIQPDGTATFIYNDETAIVMRTIGEISITRASHVEPSAAGGWFADMRPVGGPVLYDGWRFEGHVHEAIERGVQMAGAHFAVRGFATRQEALDAEIAWLRENRGL
jgi:hypothetical protein